jgi:thioredoxin-related protein
MKLLFSFILFAPLFGYTQNDNGIKFQKSSSWAQVVAKAKAEDKYIVVDCFTTWCGPCKKMDKEVYPSKDVGDYYNEKFVAIKLQMDTNKNDADDVRSLYGEAALFKKKYDVQVFPTLLYFDSFGKLLYRSVGLLTPDALIKVGINVTNPANNYYNLMAKYESGQSDPANIRKLVAQAENLGDTMRGNRVAKNFINSLGKDDWFNKENIEFISQYTASSTDKGFRIFYEHTNRVNETMDDPTFVQSFIHSIIYKEMVWSVIQKNGKSKIPPNWELLKLQISKKYNQYYAERALLAARYSWNRSMKNWNEYMETYVTYIDKYFTIPEDVPQNPIIETLTWNNRAWEVFLHSENASYLKKALKWSQYAVMTYPNANWMDTYANILYKLGQVELALTWQEIAVKLSPDDEGFVSNLENMKNKRPTWPVTQ